MASSWLSLPEAAERLGVHYMTAYRYVRTGRLPATRDGVEWRVRAADVDRFLDRGRATPSRSGRVRADAAARLERALVGGDEAGAWSVVEGALTSGATPAEVHLSMIVPALRGIGRRWERGELRVADEHRASAIAQRLVARLGPRFARRGRTRGTVVLGSVSGETHAIPGAILADLLRGRGFTVVDLGADTPAESFVDAARDASRLVTVIVGAITTGREREVRKAVRALRAAEVRAPVLVGGPGIADEALARRLGADGWTGNDGATACRAVEAIAAQPPPTKA